MKQDYEHIVASAASFQLLRSRSSSCMSHYFQRVCGRQTVTHISVCSLNDA